MPMFIKRTKGGQEVRFYANDGGGAFPRHGAIRRRKRFWEITRWSEGGECVNASSKDDLAQYKRTGLNVMAKLTQKQADKIRELLAAGWTQARTARKFGVSQSTVYFIKADKIYRGKVV